MLAKVTTNTLTKREKTEEKSTKIFQTRDGMDKMLLMEDNLTNKVELAGEVITMAAKNTEEVDSETEILRKKLQRTSLLARL